MHLSQRFLVAILANIGSGARGSEAMAPDPDWRGAYKELAELLKSLPP